MYWMLYTSFSVGARHTLLETECLWWGGDVEECWRVLDGKTVDKI